MKIKNNPLIHTLIGRIVVIQEVPLTNDGMMAEPDRMRKLVGVLMAYSVDHDLTVAPMVYFQDGGAHSLFVKTNQVEVLAADARGILIPQGYFETE